MSTRIFIRFLAPNPAALASCPLKTSVSPGALCQSFVALLPVLSEAAVAGRRWVWLWQITSSQETQGLSPSSSSIVSPQDWQGLPLSLQNLLLYVFCAAINLTISSGFSTLVGLIIVGQAANGLFLISSSMLVNDLILGTQLTPYFLFPVLLLIGWAFHQRWLWFFYDSLSVVNHLFFQHVPSDIEKCILLWMNVLSSRLNVCQCIVFTHMQYFIFKINVEMNGTAHLCKL